MEGACAGPAKERKNHANPRELAHTFELLSRLHRLLPNQLLEQLHACRSAEDKRKCDDPEFSTLERILVRHDFPKAISLSPKPSYMSPWRRKALNNPNKMCVGKSSRLWRVSEEPPMHTIIVRWLSTLGSQGSLPSAIQWLSMFGPIRSVRRYGRDSAVVVFEDLSSACRAMSAFQNHVPDRGLLCAWHRLFMNRDRVTGAGGDRRMDGRTDGRAGLFI
ncbi:testis expressed protein 56-like [Sorex fumeus]|uniref:testis expressed protein 56-like n=1 Tax=Sorex fumeus TaxID=62283 RepID=UPI0024AD9D93|nr:testis expressed protein 56-like [Sorex fumeus]